MRSGYGRRGRRAQPRSAARRLRPRRGVSPAPAHRRGGARPLRLQPHARARRDLRRAAAGSPGALPPQDRCRDRAGTRRHRSTPMSTSWPITSTWGPRWPTPTRRSTTASLLESARCACSPSRTPWVTSRAVSRWPSSSAPTTRRHAATRSWRWRRRRTGRATPSQADANFEKAAALARAMGDPERLATVALRAGPLSYLGIVGANEERMQLLEEARAVLPAEDSHLRALVTARLGLAIVYAGRCPGTGGARAVACPEHPGGRHGTATRGPQCARVRAQCAHARAVGH